MQPDKIYWEAVSNVSMVAEMLVMGYVLYRFARPFMTGRKGAFYAGAAYSAAMLLFRAISLPHDLVTYAMGTFTAFLVACRTDRRNYAQKAYIMITFFALRWFNYAMAEILYDKLYDKLCVILWKTDYAAAHPNLWFGVYAGVCVFYQALGTLFMSVSIFCILKAYTYKYADMSGKELLVLSVPSFMGVMGFVITMYYRIFYIRETGKMPDYYDMLAMLYYAAAVISVVVPVVLYQGIKAGQEEHMQRGLLAAQLDSIQYRIRQVEDLYRDIRSMKHDMTNHILTLEGLYAANKRQEAEAYSRDLKAALAKMAGSVKSGNPVTDVILEGMKNEAEKKKINFRSGFHYPADSGIESFDVSVILNNALQNALEHAGESGSPYISIFSYRKNNAFMIEVANSFSGDIRWDAQDGLPATSKKNTDSHGYGLSNIRRVAGKYHGDIDITVKDREFRLSILLMLE